MLRTRIFIRRVTMSCGRAPHSLVRMAVLSLGVLGGVTALWSEYEINSVQGLNGSSGNPVVFDLRAKRIKRGYYGISGTITIKDLFDSYNAAVNVYYSSNGGNDWKLSPINMPMGPFCDRINNEYRKFLMHELHPVSDAPYTDDPKEPLCPMFKKGAYTMNNFVYDSSRIPRFIPAGLYKIHILVFDGDTVVTSGVEAIATLN